MRTKILLAVVVLGSLLAACAAEEVPIGATTDSGTVDDHPPEAGDDDHVGADADPEYWFGEPSEPADAVRVIEIEAADDFSFTPAEVSVSVNETVTFRVANTGNLPHDFTIGDAQLQDQHEEEMASGEMHGVSDPNAMSLEPGETKELTWTFTESGTILIGCHVPGHYAAGMKGTLDIDA